MLVHENCSFLLPCWYNSATCIVSMFRTQLHTPDSLKSVCQALRRAHVGLSYCRYGHLNQVWHLLKSALPEWKLPELPPDKSGDSEEKQPGTAVSGAKIDYCVQWSHLIMQCILTHWSLMMPQVTRIWVNIGSGNDLLPDGAKPLPEPMLIYNQEGPTAFIWGHYHNMIWRSIPIRKTRMKVSFLKSNPNPPGANELTPIHHHEPCQI